MCGLCFSALFHEENVCAKHVLNEAAVKELSLKLKRRGPNHFQNEACCIHNSIDLFFVSSVLCMRGSNPAVQPLRNENGSLLLWNGEIFDGSMAETNTTESDATILNNRFSECITENDVLETIASIKGPFAFIFYQQVESLLWFGRDIFGRRSLLWKSDNNSFHLCSVEFGTGKWSNVPTNGVFCLDFRESSIKRHFVIRHYKWQASPSGSIIKQEFPDSPTKITTYDTKSTIPCPILNILNKKLPSQSEITELYGNIDRFTNFSEHEIFSALLESNLIGKTVSELEHQLSEAIRKRVNNQHYMCKDCFEVKFKCRSEVNCSHASMGVLFSGGLDSIVIAYLANRHLPFTTPIDLINVAFASKQKCNSTFNGTIFETPDRITGRNGAAVLSKLCPDRNWNFVEINVTEEELVRERANSIGGLLSPALTVLDDSIGCALWFAARCEGIVETPDGCVPYQSPCRILLIGMGADEQLGGYSRHRAKFNQSGWSGLIEELSMELDRIGSRNLGRDDRIISDHGVESRYPFLDENVVSFLNNLPVWLKMNLHFPRGVGEKLLLRLLAYKFGLAEAAKLPKRAIQFGSRIARIENTKEKGSDLCERLQITL